MFRLSFILLFISMITSSGCQRTFIYYPAKASESRLIMQAESDGISPWRNQEGEIIGWRKEAPEAKNKILVFHGNAGYALHRSYYMEALAKVGSGFEVTVFEYPGYGARSGAPSEEEIYKLATEAFELLIQEDEGPFFLAGESLGSGVACELAARFSKETEGLLLITPFTNLREVATRHFPSFLVSTILREQYDNEEALRRFNGPVAIVLAEHDEVVPADLGQQLYDGYSGPKKLLIQKGRTHNTLDLAPAAAWWTEVAEFFSELRL